MGNKQNVIELNGKRYDAKTGRQIISESATAQARPAPGMDDVVSKPRQASKPHPKVPAKQVHKRLSRSSTLTRKAVKKPAHAKKSITLGSSKVDDPSRVNRAKAMSQSKLIKHFNMSDVGSGIKKAANLPVKAAPNLRSSISMPKWPTTETMSKQVAKLQNSLENSTSHQQARLKKQKISKRIAKKLHIKTKTLHVVLVTVVVLGVGGFVAYQNMPGLALRLAATRAGIHATLPTYQPAGFSLAGPVGYSTGEVRINYKSNSDDRHYEVTQSASNWDSQTLLQNFIVTNNYKYQTFQDNGKTIYIYDNGNATWIDGGVWYHVLGNNDLSSDQLISIAGSI